MTNTDCQVSKHSLCLVSIDFKEEPRNPERRETEPVVAGNEVDDVL